MDAADEPVQSPRDTHDHRSGDPVVESVPVWLGVAAVRMEVRTIVRSVMRGFVPQIGGLPSGDELDTLVKRCAFIAYLRAFDDPDLKEAHPDELRKAVAGRVGIALAFPYAALNPRSSTQRLAIGARRGSE
jgi:hypothetical protein